MQTNKILLKIFATLILSLSAFAQPGDLLSPTAKAAFEKEDYAPCIAELSKIILREPKNSTAFLERARCYFFGADSTADYERLEKIYLLRLDADKSKAMDVVTDKFMDLRNKAKADFEQSIILNPKNAAAYNLRGYMKSLSNKNDESIADFTKAIKIEPKFIKPYFNRGNSKADKQDFDGAIADFTKVIELEPGNTSALKQRSYAFTSKNKGAISREAISDLLKLAKLEPKNKKHYEIIEYLVLNSAYPHGYADVFKQYIAINPNSPEGYLGLARSQASVERYFDLDKIENYWNTAADAYLKAIELNPAVIEPYIELFEFYFDKPRSNINAKVMAVRTLAKFPNDARSYILNGRMAENKQDWATAVKEFSRAIELSPNLSWAYERRSNAYAGLKEEDKALADLNKAIELDPSNGSAYLDRGNFQNRRKNYQEAIADFTEADKLKVTCAKTYRGILFTTLANTNKEAPNTGNFLNAQRDFLADDAQKCYLTHYMYGIMLYAQRFDEQAAQQFNLALTVYKKHGYTTEKIIEFQNRLKALPASTTSQGTQPKSNSGIDGIIAEYKSEAVKQGAKLLGSGIYNAITDVEFDLVQGETYVLVAVIEGYSPFGIDLFSYSDRDFLKPTHSWEDKEYKVESFRDYAMKSRIVKADNYSTLQLNLGLTTKSGIRRIRLSPNKEKGKPLHWIFYKLK
jgi:tetratricopeptide (TPR) repeat protein